MAEHALNDFALFINGFVVFVVDLAVAALWDDGLCAACLQPFAQGPAVIALACNEDSGWRHGLDAAMSKPAIMHVSGRQKQDTGFALLVADGMETGVLSALRDEDCCKLDADISQLIPNV